MRSPGGGVGTQEVPHPVESRGAVSKCSCNCCLLAAGHREAHPARLVDLVRGHCGAAPNTQKGHKPPPRSSARPLFPTQTCWDHSAPQPCLLPASTLRTGRATGCDSQSHLPETQFLTSSNACWPQGGEGGPGRGQVHAWQCFVETMLAEKTESGTIQACPQGG
jgi:hypothetical protein